MPRVRLPSLRSPLARAVVPVLAGVGFFVALGLVLWAVAVMSSRHPDRVALGSDRFEVGRVDRVVDSIARTGPQLYPDLSSEAGQASVVLDHQGDDDVAGWSVYRPFPADREGTDCFVVQTPLSRQFTDCAGRVLDVTQLQVAPDVTASIDGTLLVLTFARA